MQGARRFKQQWAPFKYETITFAKNDSSYLLELNYLLIIA